MEVAKSSLVNMLLEDGEEDLAVLLARSSLPDDLDLDRDAAALAHLGLAHDDLLAMLPAVPGGRVPSDADSFRRRRVMDSTVSQRWADLVTQWPRP